jgi:hypothetical protein
VGRAYEITRGDVMALSSRQQQYVDRRHATAIRLLQNGTPLGMMHRHTVASLQRRGFVIDGKPTDAARAWLAAYRGPFEPVEYVVTAVSQKAGV